MRYNKVYTAIIFAVVWLSSVLMTGVAFAQSQQPFPTQNQPGYSGQPGGQWQRPDQEGCVIQEIWHSRYAEGSSRLVIRLYNPDNENIRWNQNERVIVSDRNGRTYNTRVLKSEQNTIEFVIERLQSGEYYRIEIPDVYFRGTNCTVRGDFRAEDNWRYNLQDQEGWRYGPHDQQGFEIQEMWYRSGGRLAVKIYTPDNENIRWNQNERVIVRDRNGRTYNTRVLRAERNTIELVIERLRDGENYSIEIPGIYFRGMNYTVRGNFSAQDGWRYGSRDQQGFEIQEMWYRSGGRLAVKIYTPNNENIRWNKNERVIVRDRNGRTYNTRVVRAERNTIELVIERLRDGENYSIEIPGIYFRGMNYTVRGNFRAQDGWRYSSRDQQGFEIQEMWYRSGGRLAVKIYTPNNENIRWNKNERVIVRDRNGRTYNTRVVRAERNTIELVIERLRSGENYSIEIPGVYFRGMNYTLRGDFRAQDGWRYGSRDQQSCEIEEMWYSEGGRLEVRIYTPGNENIRWNKNQSVIVRDRNGRTYNTRVLGADRNTIALVIEKLRNGENYSIEIPGVYFRGMNYTVRGDFRAQDGWRYKK